MDVEEKRRLFTDELFLGDPSPLTMFAPTNDAIDRLLLRSLNELYDETDQDVIDYFNGLVPSIDIADSNVLVGDYLLVHDDGATAMTLILLNHVIPGLVPATNLDCGVIYNTFSGQPTTTECQVSNENGVHTILGQVGPGNLGFSTDDFPLVYPNEFELKNGVLSAVDRVILPQLGILPDPHDHIFFFLPHHEDGIVILNSFLGVSPILFTPPAPSPGPVTRRV